MENCIQAAIKFFDSPVCAGLTFGELRNLLNGVLELTLAELGNVTQLVDVAKGDRYKNQAKLREYRRVGQIGTWFLRFKVLLQSFHLIVRNFLCNLTSL